MVKTSYVVDDDPMDMILFANWCQKKSTDPNYGVFKSCFRMEIQEIIQLIEMMGQLNRYLQRRVLEFMY